MTTVASAAEMAQGCPPDSCDPPLRAPRVVRRARAARPRRRISASSAGSWGSLGPLGRCGTPQELGDEGSIGLDGSGEMPSPQGSRGPSEPLGDETEACHEPLGAIGALGGAVLGRPNHSRRATSPKGRPGADRGVTTVATEADTVQGMCPARSLRAALRCHRIGATGPREVPVDLLRALGRPGLGAARSAWECLGAEDQRAIQQPTASP